MAFNSFPQKGGIPSGNTAARPSGPVTGDTYYNGQLGQLEIYNGTDWFAVSAPPLAPTAATPTNASGSDAYSASGGKLSVVFTRNSKGGEPIQYNAYTTAGGFSTSGTTSTLTITGLTPGTSYAVYGTVQNNFGTSTNSDNTAGATPSTKPQAPTIGTAFPGASGQATLTFTAGNSGGSAITNYKYSTDGTTYVAFSPAQTTSPLTISGLTNGTSYSFYLKAVNANGDSTASSVSNSVTPSNTIAVNFLIVAGGGAGSAKNAAASCGGGGAGGMKSSVSSTGGSVGTLQSNLVLTGGTAYTVTVGAGGTGIAAINTNETGVLAASGINSSISGSGITTVTSTGGGGGAGGQYSSQASGANGGSGGGGGAGDPPGQSGGTGNSDEGYAGGTGVGSGTNANRGGAGGGGASAAGTNPGNGGATAGGAGQSNSITGTSVTYAGGGGAATYNGQTGSGGTGGGGAGGSVANGGNGTANSGGGGGAACGNGGSYFTGGSGGSGVVIISATSAASSTTGSPTYTTSGGNHIYKFTGTGSITY